MEGHCDGRAIWWRCNVAGRSGADRPHAARLRRAATCEHLGRVRLAVQYRKTSNTPGHHGGLADVRPEATAAYRFFSATSMALNMPAALFMVSSYSLMGTESATMPAPAWT